MRIYSLAALAALTASPLPKALLIEMDLAVPLNINSFGGAITIDGVPYNGAYGLGKVDALRETGAEVAQLKFEMPGVQPEHISLVLGEQVRGKAVRVKQATFDPATYKTVDVRLRWSGSLDVMTLLDGAPAATVTVTAEHAGIDLLRPQTLRYTHNDQQLTAPGDMAMQMVSDQADMRIVWPAATWGRA